MTARVSTGQFTATCPNCGYTKTSKTTGLANHALKLHTCEHQRELVARAARVQQRLTKAGTQRDCQCVRANHQHGTRTAYVVDKCRCRPCTEAATTVEAARRRQKAYGRDTTGRVDAQPVREHILALNTYGIGIKRIAQLAGVSNATLGKILYGDRTQNIPPCARVEPHVHTQVLAIQPCIENLSPGATINSIGTTRRLQALVAIGYPQSRLAKLLGYDRTNFTRTIRNTHKVTAKTFLATKDLYNELWNQPQIGNDRHSRTSATRARNYAQAHKWAPPLTWDDDTIDNPDAQPQGMDTVKASTILEQRLENLEHLLDTGAGYTEILTRLNTTRKTLETTIRRAGRTDLATRLATCTDTRRNTAV